MNRKLVEGSPDNDTLAKDEIFHTTDIPAGLHDMLEEVRLGLGNRFPMGRYEFREAPDDHKVHTSDDALYNFYMKQNNAKTVWSIRQELQKFKIKHNNYYMDLKQEVAKLFTDHDITLGLSAVYGARKDNPTIPADSVGFMGWHTNNNAPYTRMYMNYVTEADKSYFKYRDPNTEEMVKSYDKKGWQIRMFDICRRKPLWHCVYAETPRISLGLRICKKRDVRYVKGSKPFRSIPPPT